ncbi:glycosyltransferase family 2 protein [Leisingera sp. ANG-Vp]|uniref:glycosyltransferase family 2 protein n=1 Tax=Leisingera sp. ANG-Vp TaxID=1577896 RepID=UPI00068AC349|nr:glycosyltransferase family A protein [Leisingera sp. ANG-Vp]
MQPDFTVIMATWNRGRHVLPSVRAVLAQSHRNFELLVIGDDVTDSTAEHLAGIDDPRLRWINNAPRWRTQSGPNNRGIAEARAPWVAYCGHDDIWAPDHLAALWQTVQDNPGVDVAVSGLVVHRLNAARPYAVCGLLQGGAAEAERCFVQPSATAHRTALVRRHPWPRAEDVGLPVDLHLQRELAAAGAGFAASGRVTVHKFTAAGRYLSYFDVSCVEQEVMLERLQAPDWPQQLAEIVDKARSTGDYMAEDTRPGGQEVNRERLARLAQVRGIAGLPGNLAVGQGISLLQSGEPRTPDWQRFQQGERYRFTGPNPRPKMLLPLLAEGEVELRLQVKAPRPRLINRLRLWLNGTRIRHRLAGFESRDGGHFAELVLRGCLRADRASVLTLEHLDEKFASGAVRRGIAVAAVQAVPVAGG